MKTLGKPFFFFSFSLAILGGLFLSSCGVNTLDAKFAFAARKQAALDSKQLDLWARSPVLDGLSPQASALDDLDALPRTPVTFVDIVSLTEPLKGAMTDVFESTTKLSAPTFFDWAGLRIPWTRSEFQIFMAFAHVTKARQLATALVPAGVNLDFAVSGVSGPPKTRLTIFAQEPGSAFSTGYDVSNKTLTFFREESESLSRYNPVDESDAAYHEYGHVAMHAINPPVVTVAIGANTDLDFIQEGLADLFAAAIAQDENFANYLANNAPILTSSANRTGIEQNRSLANVLVFPFGYRRQSHLDGRILSGAMNDYRKWLKGDTVTQLTGCAGSSLGNCPIAPNAAPVLDSSAWETSLKLALLAFQDLSTTSSYEFYSQQLLSRCTANPLLCPNGASVALTRILQGRGLRRTNFQLNPPVPTIGDFTDVDADIQVSADLGFMPFPNDPGFANSNETLEPCELILIYPIIKNNSRRPEFLGSAFYEITIELASTTGFTPLRLGSPPKVVEPITPLPGSPLKKIFGWMDPSDTTENDNNISLIRNESSSWYVNAGSSVFTQKLGSTFFPSPVGFLAKAPSVATTTDVKRVTASFRVQLKIANSLTRSTTIRIGDSTPIVATKTVQFLQGAAPFCTGN